MEVSAISALLDMLHQHPAVSCVKYAQSILTLVLAAVPVRNAKRGLLRRLPVLLALPFA
jgi:hypothetical protein